MGGPSQGRPYVLTSEHAIEGVFALISGEDPTFGNIDRVWFIGLSYMSIHWVASREEVPGITERVVLWYFACCPNLRINAHPGNYPMQRATSKCGFSRCGVIRYLDGASRIAHRRMLTEEDA